MIKLLLFNVVNSLLQLTEPQSVEALKALKPEETAWVSGQLADSYENEILSSIGLEPHGKSMEEYRNFFNELGLEIEFIKIERQMLWFDGIVPLRDWVKSQVGTELLAEQYLFAMEQKGWVGVDGRIGFPTKQLLAQVKK